MFVCVCQVVCLSRSKEHRNVSFLEIAFSNVFRYWELESVAITIEI